MPGSAARLLARLMSEWPTRLQGPHLRQLYARLRAAALREQLTEIQAAATAEAARRQEVTRRLLQERLAARAGAEVPPGPPDPDIERFQLVKELLRRPQYARPAPYHGVGYLTPSGRPSPPLPASLQGDWLRQASRPVAESELAPLVRQLELLGQPSALREQISALRRSGPLRGREERLLKSLEKRLARATQLEQTIAALRRFARTPESRDFLRLIHRARRQPPRPVEPLPADDPRRLPATVGRTHRERLEAVRLILYRRLFPHVTYTPPKGDLLIPASKIRLLQEMAQSGSLSVATQKTRPSLERLEELFGRKVSPDTIRSYYSRLISPTEGGQMYLRGQRRVARRRSVEDQLLAGPRSVVESLFFVGAARRHAEELAKSLSEFYGAGSPKQLTRLILRGELEQVAVVQRARHLLRKLGKPRQEITPEDVREVLSRLRVPLRHMHSKEREVFQQRFSSHLERLVSTLQRMRRTP